MKHAGRWLASLLVLLLVAGCRPAALWSASGRSKFVKLPYLQNPGRTAVTIRWSSPISSGWVVRYGAGGKLAREKTADPMAKVERVPPEYLFEVRLDGLRPGTTYRYAVGQGGGAFESTFRTFPDRPEAFSFIAYGDTRTQADVHRAIAERFLQHNPAFLLHTGDAVESGAFGEWQGLFFDPLADVIGRVPLWIARGNHDGGAQGLRRLFTFPQGRLFYSFDYGNTHFVCLDALARDRKAMLEWCRKDLAASTARWKFVFLHYPMYDVGSHHSNWGRSTFLPVFRKYGVDFVLAGHSHGYQRFRPMFVRDENEDRPITHIVTAGGGAMLYRVEDDPHLAVGRSAHHYLVFRIDGAHLSARAVTPDGHTIDAFEVTKTGGRADRAYLSRALPEETFGELSAEIAPYLRGILLPEPPRRDRSVATTFALGAGPHRMRFRIDLEERARKHYEITPIAGTTPPGGQVSVVVSIRAKGEVRTDERGVLWPVLRLRCEYEIGGKRGALYSSRLQCPVPAGGKVRP